MKRLKLHKSKDLKRFVKECRLVIRKSNDCRDYSDEHYKELISSHQVERLWVQFACDDRLWLNGYACFLPIKVRNTFEYYRKLDMNDRVKKLRKSRAK